MQVYFTVNVGRKFRDSSWCPLNRGYTLTVGSHLIQVLLYCLIIYMGSLSGFFFFFYCYAVFISKHHVITQVMTVNKAILNWNHPCIPDICLAGQTTFLKIALQGKTMSV